MACQKYFREMGICVIVVNVSLGTTVLCCLYVMSMMVCMPHCSSLPLVMHAVRSPVVGTLALVLASMVAALQARPAFAATSSGVHLAPPHPSYPNCTSGGDRQGVYSVRVPPQCHAL